MYFERSLWRSLYRAHNLFAPKIENSVEDLKNLVYTKFHRLYGDNPPELMVKRVETELHDIINCHYDVIYMSAQKLVQRSLENGYLVGSRGSVGSSLVAYMSGIIRDISRTSDGGFDYLFICIFLSLDMNRRVECRGTKPEVSIETRIFRLLMNMHPRDINQQFFV